MRLSREVRTFERAADEMASMSWSAARFHKTAGQGIIAPLAFARSLFRELVEKYERNG